MSATIDQWGPDALGPGVTVVPDWTTSPCPGVVRADRRLDPTSDSAATDAPRWREVHRYVIGLLSGETEVSTASKWLTADSLECSQPGLTVQYRRDRVVVLADSMHFDHDFADRLAGYLSTALGELARGAALPGPQDLIDDAERARLLTGLSGGAMALPDLRFPDLFARRANLHPDRTAVRCGGRDVSYGSLLSAASVVADRLLADGLQPEEVVTVSAGRSAEWIAAIIGIFAAGGVYLPVDPDYPAARIRSLQTQAKSTRLLSGRALADILDAAAAQRAGVWSDGKGAAGIGPDRLAYVYFTSGSTGTPKGAMCQHDGMINHLLAKIADFDLDERTVVAQTAQATFDISLWQALAPLLVGGRTVIVDKEHLLDVPIFVRLLADERVTVAQLVPAYLDVLTRHAQDNPLQLPDLSCVSVTGEAVTADVVRRFFQVLPHRTLINAYGATEASDDTTHEIMRSAPAGSSIPVGRPVGNVEVTIVGHQDDPDALLPLGCVGEITFSGVSVGRGYLHDPQRTAEVFGPDPHRPGMRRYRTGDFGRWLPNGHLEFHGRRDEQVKVRGIRLELGEVEHALRDVDGVRTAAAVAVPAGDAGHELVAFYTCSTPAVEPAVVRKTLAGTLPPAAVPSRLIPLPSLPLNDNGKVDKKALVATALGQHGRTPAQATRRSARTGVGERIAAGWSAVLGVPVTEITGRSDFFALGGTSLGALRVVGALDGLITIEQLLRHPVFADLVAVVTSSQSAQRSSDATTTPLLQRLSGPTTPTWALVGFPPAGGTAETFRALAAALSAADPSVAVHALTPPGWVPGSVDDFKEYRRLADAVGSEIREQFEANDTPVVLWGHCAGAALAVHCALMMPELVRAVFVGAHPGVAADRLRRQLARTAAASPATLLDELSRVDAGLTASESPAALTELVRRYQQESIQSDGLLLDLLAERSRRLTVPLTVVTAADDPLAGPTSVDSWRAVADSTATAVLADGGHLFYLTRPAAVADLIVQQQSIR